MIQGCSQENGTSSKVLANKTEQRESKAREDKKKVREDALLVASKYQAIYLKSGKKISLQEVVVPKSFSNASELYSSIVASNNNSGRNNDKIIIHNKWFYKLLTFKMAIS